MLAAGFDPGIAAAGLGAVRRDPDRYRVIEAKCVRTKASDSLADRCGKIWDALSLLFRTHTPDVLTIEEQQGAQAGAYREGDFNSDNSKTHVTVGLAIGCGRAYRVPVLVIGPRTLNVAVLGTGNANADKHQVQRAIELLCGVRLAQAQADAVKIAIGGAKRWQIENHVRIA